MKLRILFSIICVFFVLNYISCQKSKKKHNTDQSAALMGEDDTDVDMGEVTVTVTETGVTESMQQAAQNCFASGSNVYVPDVSGVTTTGCYKDFSSIKDQGSCSYAITNPSSTVRYFSAAKQVCFSSLADIKDAAACIDPSIRGFYLAPSTSSTVSAADNNTVCYINVGAVPQSRCSASDSQLSWNDTDHKCFVPAGPTVTQVSTVTQSGTNVITVVNTAVLTQTVTEANGAVTTQVVTSYLTDYQTITGLVTVVRTETLVSTAVGTVTITIDNTTTQTLTLTNTLMQTETQTQTQTQTVVQHTCPIKEEVWNETKQRCEFKCPLGKVCQPSFSMQAFQLQAKDKNGKDKPLQFADASNIFLADMDGDSYPDVVSVRKDIYEIDVIFNKGGINAPEVKQYNIGKDKWRWGNGIEVSTLDFKTDKNKRASLISYDSPYDKKWGNNPNKDAKNRAYVYYLSEDLSTMNVETWNLNPDPVKIGKNKLLSYAGNFDGTYPGFLRIGPNGTMYMSLNSGSSCSDTEDGSCGDLTATTWNIGSSDSESVGTGTSVWGSAPYNWPVSLDGGAKESIVSVYPNKDDRGRDIKLSLESTLAVSTYSGSGTTVSRVTCEGGPWPNSDVTWFGDFVGHRDGHMDILTTDFNLKMYPKVNDLKGCFNTDNVISENTRKWGKAGNTTFAGTFSGQPILDIVSLDENYIYVRLNRSLTGSSNGVPAAAIPPYPIFNVTKKIPISGYSLNKTYNFRESRGGSGRRPTKQNRGSLVIGDWFNNGLDAIIQAAPGGKLIILKTTINPNAN